MEAKHGCDDLGFVESIFDEEEDEYGSATSLSSSTHLHHSCVDYWCRATGNETDVVIYVQDSPFHLHKEPLTSKSGYLKRHVNKVAELTLSPPLNLTAETFTMLVEFFYGSDLIITPFNVAALRTAAELLELNGGEGLIQKTENYFRRSVAVRQEYTLIVLRSSLSLLPESETTAFLASRCIEALWVMGEADGIANCIGDVKELAPKGFLVILNSMNKHLGCSHDLLYKLLDLYLKEYNGKITEEQKLRICNNVNCAMLSPKLVMHAVQNMRMPLRFVVQAMFVEQLNTRRSIVSAANDNNNNSNRINPTLTLGAILERDAARRQSAILKEAMHATSSRILSLEKELSDMRKLLNDTTSSDSCHFASFRHVSSLNNKIGKGERGSVSSRSFRNNKSENNSKHGVTTIVGSSSSKCLQDEIPVAEKYNLRQRFIRGLKSTFRISKSKKKSMESTGRKLDGDEIWNDEDIVVIKKDIFS